MSSLRGQASRSTPTAAATSKLKSPKHQQSAAAAAKAAEEDDAQPELTKEEQEAAFRAAAQAMKADPSKRRGYTNDVTSLLDSSGAAHERVSGKLREANQKLYERVTGIHAKVKEEERQHKRSEGVPVTKAAKPKKPIDIDLADFQRPEDNDDDDLQGGMDDLEDDDDDAAAFEAEEREYQRLLEKEVRRKQHASESSAANALENSKQRSTHVEQFNTAEFMLNHTREKNLTDIRTLYLGNKRLHDIPTIVGSLSNLRSLDLNANQLKTIPPSHPVTKLIELRELKVQHNMITNMANLRVFPHLQTLRADYNQLSDISTVVNDNSKLEFLSLSSNRISEIKTGYIAASSLHSLDLSSNQLTSLSFLPSLVNLQEFFANNNRIRGSIPNLSKLTQLDELQLNHNLIESMDGMGTMSKLTILQLSHNRLKRITGAVVAAPAVVSPTAAAATAKKDTKKEGIKPYSAAAAAKQDAEINAATIAAKANAPTSAQLAAQAAAAAKSFPIFPNLTDFLCAHNDIEEIREEVSIIYPQIETFDVRYNKLHSTAAELVHKLKPLALSIVDLRFDHNPFVASRVPENNGVGKTASSSSHESNSSLSASSIEAGMPYEAYRALFVKSFPCLESLDELEIEGRAKTAENLEGVIEPLANNNTTTSRPATAAGNATPRMQAAGSSMSSRPSTSSGSRPGTASGAARGGNPLMMRPPSARASRPTTMQTGGAAAAASDADQQALTTSNAALNYLDARMQSNVSETTAQLAAMKLKFQNLLAAQAETLKKRGFETKIGTHSTTTAAPSSTATVARDEDIDDNNDPDTSRSTDSTLSTARSSATFLTTPSKQATAIISTSVPTASPAASAAAGRQTPDRPTSRPASVEAGMDMRPSSADRRGVSTPRQRLEQAKLFSDSVYNNNGGGNRASIDAAANIDPASGQVLPIALTKQRSGSAPYKPQHAKPSFTNPQQPLTPLSNQPTLQVSDEVNDTDMIKPATPSMASKPSTPSSAAGSRVSTASGKTKPSTAAAAASKPKVGSSAATGIPVSSNPLFSNPFAHIAPAGKAASAKPGSAAKPSASAAAAAAAAAVAAEAATPKASVVKSLPVTKGVSITPSKGVRQSVPAAASNTAANPSLSISANRPASLAAANTNMAAAPTSTVKPAPAALTIRQQLLAAQLAQQQVEPIEEIDLTQLDDAADDNGGDDTLESAAAGADDSNEADVDDPSNSLFARPWSAHARATHSALNSARSRPQSAARNRMMDQVPVEGDAVYSSFSIPVSDPSLAQQLQNQIHVSNTYAKAFAMQKQMQQSNSTKQLQTATPRGSLPVSQNPFLLKSTVYSGK